jgi:thiamine biosynthesis lipoprotein
MPATIHKFSHEAMTTSFDALIIHPDKTYAGQAAAGVFAEISRLERLLSRFDPGTDLAQANRLRPGQFMAVNLEIVECLELAARAYQVTGGTFDVAYRSRRGGTRPSAMDFLLLSRPEAGELAVGTAEFLVGLAPEAAAYGYGDDMTIPLAARTLEPDKSADPTPPDGLNLDLGGIGKGYALDKSLQILDDWGIDNALLSAGTSTVLARGDGPDGAGWPVGVSGDYGRETGIDKIHLLNQALSGSGTAVKGEHIRTPETGAAAPALAAWARAESAAWTDGISTALMVLPRDKAAAMIHANPDTHAIVIYGADPPLLAGTWSGVPDAV